MFSSLVLVKVGACSVGIVSFNSLVSETCLLTDKLIFSWSNNGVSSFLIDSKIQNFFFIISKFFKKIAVFLIKIIEKPFSFKDSAFLTSIIDEVSFLVDTKFFEVISVTIDVSVTIVDTIILDFDSTSAFGLSKSLA